MHNCWSPQHCFSLQAMTAYRPVLDGTPSLAATVVQVLQDLFYVLSQVLFYLWSLLKWCLTADTCTEWVERQDDEENVARRNDE